MCSRRCCARSGPCEAVGADAIRVATAAYAAIEISLRTRTWTGRRRWRYEHLRVIVNGTGFVPWSRPSRPMRTGRVSRVTIGGIDRIDPRSDIIYILFRDAL